MSDKIDFAVGGQALIEGVMIRSPSYVTIAVRNPQKKIIIKEERFISLTEKYPVLKLPFLRASSLNRDAHYRHARYQFSAEVSIEDEEEMKHREAQEKNKTSSPRNFLCLQYRFCFCLRHFSL